MNLASFLYRSALEGGPMKKRLFRRLRQLRLKMGDPECEMEVHGRKLAMPLSHLLPWHRLNHPCYDALPQRLAGFLRDRTGTFNAIDVGANIGDTIASFHLEKGDSVLAIEPAPGFVRYLRKNWAGDDRVTIVESVCSSKNDSNRFSMEEIDGTARLKNGTESENGGLASQTLDQILETNRDFYDPNLVKIDTDGHDLEVISGGLEVIERSKAAVFFECDAFDDPAFPNDCLDTLATFHRVGYAGMLVYDNFGYLMGRIPLDQLDAFAQMLFYQVTSEFYYFDLLLIHGSSDLDRFHEQELQFFAERKGKPDLRPAAALNRPACEETAVELAG